MSKKEKSADRGSMEPIDKTGSGGNGKFVAGAMVVLAVIAVGFFLYTKNQPHPPREETKQEADIQISVPRPMNFDLPDTPEPEPLPLPDESPPESITVAEVLNIAPVPEENPILQRRLSSGFSLSGDHRQGGDASTTENGEEKKPVTTNDAVNHRNPNHETQYDGQGVAKVSASRIPNRSLLLTQGTKIPCTLETALDSTVPGMTSCIVGEDIYSSDGKVRLIDRGSKLNGQYQSNLRIGQVRIGIVWQRLETPDGVLIDLSSPSTDTLGRAGAGGRIDTHFWARFGHAIMLSLVSDAFQYLDNRRDNRRFQDTQDSLQDMANIALQNEIDIPPTIYKNQGEPIMVFLNRDLSFEKVYELSLDGEPRNLFGEKFRASLAK